MVFDLWTGDVDALENPAAAHTRVLMSSPRGSVTVTAGYRTSPEWNASSEPFNGVTLSYYVPPGPLRGVITLHHGAGGSGAGFFTRPEYRNLGRDAAAQGYALVALDSLNRVDKQWAPDFSATNVDIVNVLSALALLTNRGLLPPGLPRCALGMSNGGGFVPKLAYFGGYVAADSYCAQASNFGISNVPLTWNMAMNDGNSMVGTAGNASALANLGTTLARGVAASYARQAPSPVHPRRFLRCAGLGEADSDAIYQAIKSAGFLDAYDFLTAPPDQSGVLNTIPIRYLPSAQQITDQVKVCWADHEFFADHDDRTLAFFADPSAASARQTPRLINLSTRAQTLGGDGVLIGGIVVQGSSTQRVIVRGLGPSLTAFGVVGALSDPELQIVNSAGQQVAANTDWRSGGQTAEIMASGFAPTDDREAAVILDLAPGSYTALVRGAMGATGVALVEAYSLQTGSGRLGNVSTRARVGSDDKVLIGGFVIGAGESKRVVLRALGPSLTAFGVAGALPDPQLELRDASGRLLARSDDWQLGAQRQEILASLFSPPSPADAALVAVLAPGPYTVIVRGKNGAEGVALVEAYELF